MIVKERHIGDISVEQFSERLKASLSAWREEGRRGVWLRIPIHQSDFIPVAVKVNYSPMVLKHVTYVHQYLETLHTSE